MKFFNSVALLLCPILKSQFEALHNIQTFKARLRFGIEWKAHIETVVSTSRLDDFGENVLMVTLGYGILVTVVDLRVLVTLFYSMELW